MHVGADAVKRMPLRWSLNPYLDCAHRCTFCCVQRFNRIGRPRATELGALPPYYEPHDDECQ